MNNQEAIRWIRHLMSTVENFNEEERQACEMAIEVLKKQIPKMPIAETISMSTNEPPLIVGFCPNCTNNRPMVTNRYDLYCRSCGQKLDWESEVKK